MTDWTETELSALRRAYASGTTRVSYDGKSVDYGSAEDLLARKRICATRLSFMRSLNIWNTFGRGWARRVADIEAKGVAWALTAANDNSDLVKQQLGDEADKARSQAGKQTGAAAGAGGGGAVSLDQGAQLGDWILAGIAFVAFAALAFLIIRAVINTHRATAYAKEAANA